MAIRAATPAEFEAVQEELRQLYRPPRVANVGAVLLLDDDGGLSAPFRGRVYQIPPVSWRLGVQLLELRHELEALEATELTAPEERGRYGQLLELAARIIKRHVRPDRGWWRRLTWRFRRNPWREASEAELGEWLGFFWIRRTISHGRPASSPNNLHLST